MLGGVLADAWRRVTPCGRLYVGMLAAVLPVPIAYVLLTTESLPLAYALVLPSSICSSMWIGPGASTMQDLVLPRIRGAASAAYLLVITFIGLALGPYTVGLLSVALGSLRGAMLAALLANVAALGFAIAAARNLVGDEETRLERARAAGEPIAPAIASA
jgi:MFS family permease